MPAYNGSRHIVECLTSLIVQTYKNIEIVFVDDASDDDTLILASALLEQSQVDNQIVALKVNRGVSAARNAGIKRARGEYLFFLDADDFLLSGSIERIYEATSAVSPAADVTLSGYRTIDRENGKETLYQIDKSVTAFLSPDVIAWKYAFNKIHSVIGALYKKDFIFGKGIFFSENCISGEDGEFALKALSVSSRTAICHETEYVYRLHDGMGSREKASEARIRRYIDHTEAQERTAEFILRHSQSPLLLKLASSLMMPVVVMRRLSCLAMTKDKPVFDKALAEIDFRLLMKSAQYLLIKPENFFRVLFLRFNPNAYYEKYARRYM